MRITAPQVGSRWLLAALAWGLSVALASAQAGEPDSTDAQTPTATTPARADDARRGDGARATSEGRDVVARAGESARRQGQPSARSRPDRRDPDRRGQQRMAAAALRHTPGAGPDVRHRLPALGSVQRRADRAGHCARHAARRTARRRRAAGQSAPPFGGHVRRRLHRSTNDRRRWSTTVSAPISRRKTAPAIS